VVLNGRDRRCFGAGGGHCSGAKGLSCTRSKVRDARIWRKQRKKLGSVVL